MEVPNAFATTAVLPVSGPMRMNSYWYVPLPPVADAVQVTVLPATAEDTLGVMELIVMAEAALTA